MRTFLLLHGALRGAWLWEKLMPLLLREGVNAIAIDLPGHGSRSAKRKGITMSSYIYDVLEFIRGENLQHLVLVGHSMSGMIISKVAEEMPERIKHLCYLAAVVPGKNDALIDLLTPERAATLRDMEGKVDEIFGPIETLKPAYFTDLYGKEQEFYLRQLTPQPLAVFFEKIQYTKSPELSIPKTYIMGLKDKSLPPDLTKGFADRLGVQPFQIDAGHDMMVSQPAAVAEVLLNIN